MSFTLNSYQDALTWLYERFPSYQNLGAQAYKPGLENTISLLKTLGNPERSLNIIHVAGTNGKGSTCAFTSALLQKKGLCVGLFTSPHIHDFRERIRINGIAISEERVLAFCRQLKECPIDASFFEITLALALVYFKEKKCDWVILETGMGGRLDATNVVQPKLCIITSIGLDHQAFLGNTLQAIAMEKAGIIKPKTPVVCGEKDPELMALFRRQSEHQEAPFHTINAPMTENQDGIPLYQHYNFALAQKGLSLLGYDTSMEEIQGLWPHLFSLTGFYGRLTPSLSHPRLWYDVSHNPAGFKATMKSLKLLGSKKLILIFGASNDKEVSHLIEYMHEPIRWCFAEFSNPRSIRKDGFLSLWPETIKKRWHCFDSVDHALTDALHMRDEDTGILVTGSFFLLSDVPEIQQTIENHLNQ